MITLGYGVLMIHLTLIPPEEIQNTTELNNLTFIKGAMHLTFLNSRFLGIILGMPLIPVLLLRL